ncbi:hypothetical protein [Paraburkholderia azotifigens]|uniref:Uncharacterized protein n=1 Tax=Paraburkholderia azotifigens TaxID=2057004 RepID=A0ABU9R4U6_9BURK|nr:hypothetical protein [Paraburkholderia azotifigens]
MMRATARDFDVKTSSMPGTSFRRRPGSPAAPATFVEKLRPPLPGARRFYEQAQILAVTPAWLPTDRPRQIDQSLIMINIKNINYHQ